MGRAARDVLVLVAAVIGLFAVSVRNDFTWDDERIIVENPDTRDASAIGRVLLSPDEIGSYYRPLSRASFLLDYQAFGMDPRGFHAVNVALHLAAVVLLYLLVARWLGGRRLAMIAALLLAVHPLAAEPVNLVSARNNLLALAFSLAAALLFQEAHARRSWPLAVLSAVAFTLGLLSKEPGLMVLGVLAVWLVWPAAAGRPRRMSSFALLLPHAVGVIAYLIVRRIAVGPAASFEILDGLAARAAWNLYLVPKYVALALVPADLTIFHRLPETVTDLPAGTLIACAAGWVAITAVAFAIARRPTPASAFGLLWVVFAYAPIANLVPIPSTGVFTERYFYIPAVGLWLIGADVVVRLAARSEAWRRGAFLLAGLAVAALAGRTMVRNLDWRDDVTLAQSAIRSDPGSVRAHYNLGVAFKDRGKVADARREWEAALALSGDDAAALAQLGTLCAVEGDLGLAERYLAHAARVDPSIALVHFNLARVYDLTGKGAAASRAYQAFLERAQPAETDPERLSFARARRLALEP